MFEMDEPKKKAAYTLGADLSAYSVGDLDELDAELAAERKRVQDERARKSADLDAASALFKS